MNHILFSIAQSWFILDSPVNPTSSILSWIEERNRTVSVDIHKIQPEKNGFWFYDQEKGCIRNQNHSFFTITGYEKESNGRMISQPIILQQEIGYLGIICREINGIMHFLMQAKIEPGNINKIQISPTIKATKIKLTQNN